jgi:cell division protein FtsN
MTNRNTSRVTVRSQTLARAAAWVALTIVLALSLVVIFKETTGSSTMQHASPVSAPAGPPKKTGPWHYPPQNTNV